MYSLCNPVYDYYLSNITRIIKTTALVSGNSNCVLTSGDDEDNDEDNDEMDEDEAMLNDSEEETTTNITTDVAHESDLKWKENLFYRGEEELSRRRIFSNNLMQLVYGSPEEIEEESKAVIADDEEENSDDDFFHPKRETQTITEAEKQQRMLEELDSEKLDILPAVKHVSDNLKVLEIGLE